MTNDLYDPQVLSPMAEGLIKVFSDIANSIDLDNEWIDFETGKRVPKPAPCPPEFDCPICSIIHHSQGPHNGNA